MKRRPRILTRLSKAPFDANLARRNKGAVTPGSTRDSNRQKIADFVPPKTPETLDRVRLIRAYFTIDDPAMRESLVSIAEQLANGQSPMLLFGPMFFKPRRLRKSRLVSS
jgi:hypothetical protein